MYAQGCCLTGTRSPGAPKLCMRATKFLYKEPARAPISLRLSWDNGPYFPINLILLAELQTMELYFSQTRNKSVQQQSFEKPLFVSCWQMLETGHKMWFPNMEYQNHGLFCWPRHSQVITRWRHRRLLCRFSKIFFLFLWEERVDNLCATDSTCLIFDFMYKFALNRSSFFERLQLRRMCNVISLYSNKEFLWTWCNFFFAASAHFLHKSLKVSLALMEYNPMAAMKFSQQEQIKYIKLFFFDFSIRKHI